MWRTCLIFVIYYGIREAEGRIRCDIETYVQTGLEYRVCQKRALQEFPDHLVNPCPMLESVTATCAEVIKKCFDRRGWERGLQMYVDLAIMQFQHDSGRTEMHFCDIFNGTISKENTTIPWIASRVPGELCSIQEESVLMDDIQMCISNAESNIILDMNNHHQSLKPPPMTTLMDEFRDRICSQLDSVRNECISSKLKQCVDDHDLPFYEAYLLEFLKTDSLLILTHFYSHSNNTKSVISDCPVFARTTRSTSASTNTSFLIVISVCAVIVTTFLVLFVSVYVYFRFRIYERSRAAIQRQPYEEFVIRETNVTTTD